MPSGVTRPALSLDPSPLRAGTGTIRWRPRLAAADRAWRAILHEADGTRHAFLDLARPDSPVAREAMRATIEAADWARGRFEHLLLLGIGGSALGARAIDRFVRPRRDGGMRLHVLDNVDPETVAGTLAALPPSRTLVNVVSKSGTTMETAAQWAIVRRWLGRSWRKQVVATTDPERGLLREMARREGVRTLPIPPSVGGRFSVLTAVGLFPAACVGIPPRMLVHGASRMLRLATVARGASNPVLQTAAVLDAAAAAGRPMLVLFVYGDRLGDVGDWYRQLLAESVGKPSPRGARGITPVLARGATDQHSQLQLYMAGPQDKTVWFWSLGGAPRVPIPRDRAAPPAGDLGALLDAERYGTMEGLRRAGRPCWNLRLRHPHPADLGAIFLLLEAQVAVLGRMWGLDPYDQPGVEAGKRLARARLERTGAARKGSRR